MKGTVRIAILDYAVGSVKVFDEFFEEETDVDEWIQEIYPTSDVEYMFGKPEKIDVSIEIGENQ